MTNGSSIEGVQMREQREWMPPMSPTHSRHSSRRFRMHARPFISLTLGLLSAAALVAPAAARETVDPATLNPPPPDTFNAECFAGAGGTVCTLHFSDEPIVDEPSGIICGGTELVVSQQRSVIGKRDYDADGNLVRRHFRESLSGTFSNPDTGATVLWIQHDTIVHNLSEPGNLDSGITRSSGLFTRVWLPGAGSVLLDVGRVLVDEATGEVLASGGRHPFGDYFERGDASALQPICDALAS
jgi:hypothetical protein